MLQTGLTGRTHALCGPRAPATAHLPWKQQHSTFTFIDNILNVWEREGFFFFFKVVEKRNTLSLRELTQLRRSVGVSPDP